MLNRLENRFESKSNLTRLRLTKMLLADRLNDLGVRIIDPNKFTMKQLMTLYEKHYQVRNRLKHLNDRTNHMEIIDIVNQVNKMQKKMEEEDVYL